MKKFTVPTRDQVSASSQAQFDKLQKAILFSRANYECWFARLWCVWPSLYPCNMAPADLPTTPAAPCWPKAAPRRR